MNINKIDKLRVDVRSSLIRYLEYDCIKFILKVRFKKRKNRIREHFYHDIMPEQFEIILSSESIGRAVLRLVSAKESVKK